MKIAIIGSGIAGLSAAWLLSQDHDVTLFEKAGRLGMDAHGLDIDGTDKHTRIDVPLRVFFDGFYPNLTALYDAIGIQSQPINYSASFGQLDAPSYFRYANLKLGKFALPLLKGSRSFNRTALRISWDILHLFRRLSASLERGIPNTLTLEDFIDHHNYSRAFAEGFLYPAFAGICTCSHERIKAYPARVVLEYLNSRLLFSSVRRVTQGTQDVVQRLAKQVQATHLDTTVLEIGQGENDVHVITSEGRSSFDHVILATQANQSVKLLPSEFHREREVLEKFIYEPSRVIVHRDASLAPKGGSAHWAPVNFLLEARGTTPMATIWMNAIQSMPEQDDLFQTWNPIKDPDPSLVLADSRFERPVVNHASLNALKRLEHLHEQTDRRVWFCGSYAAHGIPLLESAAHSALAVAERLGSQRPWEPKVFRPSGAGFSGDHLS